MNEEMKQIEERLELLEEDLEIITKQLDEDVSEEKEFELIDKFTKLTDEWLVENEKMKKFLYLDRIK